ncbi:hypothetical protein FHS42_002142 [Streptomyces zagrosensis]|uniref:Uncharacterized protein n=1 Tax=Streptomyces zagrosensis TaxID=1042984 RepID=A0A7W9Q9R4_9ACTN|nr:hypothetical protein [Streptomyces zagrosensis]
MYGLGPVRAARLPRLAGEIGAWAVGCVGWGGDCCGEVRDRRRGPASPAWAGGMSPGA